MTDKKKMDKQIRDKRISLVIFFTIFIILVPLVLWGASVQAALTIIILEGLNIIYAFKYFNPKPAKNHPIFNKDFLKSRNPYHWYGFILLIVGVVAGGVIGAVVLGLTGFKIMKLGDKKYSLRRKIIYLLLLTIGGIGLYIVLAIVFYLVIASIFP